MRDAQALGAWRTAAVASLALAEVELRRGAGQTARERLFNLETDARGRGYLLLANKARAAAALTAEPGQPVPAARKARAR